MSTEATPRSRAVCTWCRTEMQPGGTCNVSVLHRAGTEVAMVPYGGGRRRPASNQPCGDCGVAPGAWHHPGCDLQDCPLCHRQMISCGCRYDEDGVDPDDDPDSLSFAEVRDLF